MHSYVDYDDYDLALAALGMMRKMTGDKCHLICINCHTWRVVRIDPAGKEVEWE